MRSIMKCVQLRPTQIVGIWSQDVIALVCVRTVVVHRVVVPVCRIHLHWYVVDTY